MTEFPSLTERAIRLAVSAHAGQVRKDAPTPYIVHPFGVALIVATYEFSEPVIAAALLHDVLEDTDVSEDELRAQAGDEVLAIVKSVTNDDALGWEEKKKKYIETVRIGGEGAWAVATADKIHNAESLLAAYAEQGPTLWEKFNAGREKKIWFERAMLEMLEAEWQHPLVERYKDLVHQMEALA